MSFFYGITAQLGRESVELEVLRAGAAALDVPKDRPPRWVAFHECGGGCSTLYVEPPARRGALIITVTSERERLKGKPVLGSDMSAPRAPWCTRPASK